jgi:hypothetical protein
MRWMASHEIELPRYGMEERLEMLRASQNAA